MSEKNKVVKDQIKKNYDAGFVTDIESDTIVPGLNEDVIRLISSKKMNLNLCWPGD